MNWKSWPYWVRGALIGCVCFIIPITLLWLPLGEKTSLWVFLIFIFSLVPSSIVSEFLLGPGGEGIPLFGITTLDIAGGIIFYAIVGAIIGYLYGKIKDHKK